MFAMLLLHAVSSPATIAASMGDLLPKTNDDAPASRAGRQTKDFLGPRGMGEAQGKKV